MGAVLAKLRQRDSRVLAIFLVLLIAGIFILGPDAHALGTDERNWVGTTLGWLLGAIIGFLGKLIILVTAIMIQIAQFNEFVHAAPVEIGWVLVRDVVNMFFIVILLVSAFSTIIGYTAFHYKSVLPKLLLMAVLINFSKTLVGLMIDFSQVIMLTFVNAFAQAAGGNIVSALKLADATKLNEAFYGSGEFDLVNLLGAAFLAIVMLGATLTLLIIMTAFLVFRIVGLWIILIISPIAFFALALPDKLQKGVAAFSSDWWSKLSTLLIAGPVMAFFLWLTLAVTQSSQEPFGEVIGRAGETDEATQNAQFVTQIGKASNLATFMVAFVLMLEGVNFAVRQAGAVSPSLGKFAALTAAGGGVGVHLARGAARVGRFAARGTGRAMGAAATTFVPGAVERVGRAGLAVAGRIPGAPGAEQFAQLATTRARAIRRRGEEIEGVTKGLSAADRIAFLQAGAGAMTAPARAAREMKFAQEAGSRGGFKVLQDQELKKLKDIEDPHERTVMAEALANQKAGEAIKMGRAAAVTAGDDKVVEALDEQINKNTSLQVDWAGLGAIQATDDHKGYLRGKTRDAFKDSGAFLAHGRALGFVGDDGSIDRSHAAFQYLEQTGGDRWKFVQQHVNDLESEPERAAAQIRAFTDEGARAEANTARSFVSKDPTDPAGTVRSVRLSAARAGGAAAAPAAPTPAAAVRTQAVAQLAALAQQGVPVNEGPALAAQTSAIRAGVPLAQASGFNPAVGEFATAQHRQAFKSVAQRTAEGLQSEEDQVATDTLDVIDGLDTSSLKTDVGGLNEARSALLSQVKPEALRRGYGRAVAANRPASQKKIKEILELYRREGARLKDQTRGLKMKDEEIASVATAPEAAENLPLRQKLVERFGTADRAVEAAQIIKAANEFEIDEQYRGIRQVLDPRAARRMRGRGQGGGEA